MTLNIQRRYRLIKDLPSEIPLFPLDGVILLPRSALPLNIFEPRYLAMTDDVLAGGRLIGMIQPQSGEHEDYDSEHKVPVRQIGCVGRITEFSEVDDGRMLITLTGIARFEVIKELAHDKPYRTFQVDYSSFEDDLLPGFGETKVDRDNLLGVLKTYLEANDLDADWDSIYQSSNEFLVNTLSIISPYGPEEKQALLEAKDLKNRSEVLIALAEMDLASGSDGSNAPLQ